MSIARYTEESIRTLDWRTHIRLRPGMYIGKLGDGSSPDDGIYLLIKEVVDNSVDEFLMGFGKEVHITVSDGSVRVQDHGRGIPLGKLFACVAEVNTGAKFDSEVFQKCVGLNGIGTKAVNALSSSFVVQSSREGKTKRLEFSRGELLKEHPVRRSEDDSGTLVEFTPDAQMFKHYQFVPDYLERMVRYYAYLNPGLTVVLNGQRYQSRNGLLDLLARKTESETVWYPIIHLKGRDIEIAIAHGNEYGESYYSFVNGQNTQHGGTHLNTFREALVKTVRDFYKKNFDVSDIRGSIVAAISLRIQEPVFDSQTKTRLGSVYTSPKEDMTIRAFVGEFVRVELDNFLHKHPDTAAALLHRIQRSERERKEMAGVKQLANQRARTAAVHNRKLRDCRVHYTDADHPRRMESTLFITEGDSASGSITKARDVDTQAVFSLRGKPLNCLGMTKKVVYQNEELSLLQHALDIEDGTDRLRYARVVVTTDADVDGMHIRLLLTTFFLHFHPDLVRAGHVYVLETPLFRVRSKKDTVYCYSEKDRDKAVQAMGQSAEITRFKGLGEISPSEFSAFIGPEMRLTPLVLSEQTSIDALLSYYMGKNTPERQNDIIANLKVEHSPSDRDQVGTQGGEGN